VYALRHLMVRGQVQKPTRQRSVHRFESIFLEWETIHLHYSPATPAARTTNGCLMTRGQSRGAGRQPMCCG
jgi:hypothetical protein